MKLEAARRAVDTWNQQHDVGVEVDVRKDDGSTIPTKTRAAAQIIGDGPSPVIWLVGIAGCYRLDRVRAAANE